MARHRAPRQQRFRRRQQTGPRADLEITTTPTATPEDTTPIVRTEVVTLDYPDGSSEPVGVRHGGSEGEDVRWEVLVGPQVQLVNGMVARVGRNVIAVAVGETK